MRHGERHENNSSRPNSIEFCKCLVYFRTRSDCEMRWEQYNGVFRKADVPVHGGQQATSTLFFMQVKSMPDLSGTPIFSLA